MFFRDLSKARDIGSPRANDYEFLELPYMPEDPYVEAALQAPPSPDYVAGPEEPEQAPLLPNYVPGPKHADDEIVAEDQPGAEDASPTAQSPDYVPETDPEADPEEDDDEDPEEDPIDYPADGGDDGDDEMDIEEDEDDDMDIEADEEDEDDEMDVEVDEEAEEEHPAPAYPVVVALPATAPSAEETEPFETDESAATPPPHPAYRMTARITIPEPVPVPAWSDSEVARLLAISSPPASPLSPWSSSPPQIPFPLPPPIPSPSLPLSPPSPVLSAPPPSPIRSLGYRAAMIRMRAEAAATSHSLPLPPPFILSPTRLDAPPPMPTSAPTSLPPLLLPSASRREDRPEVNLPPRKRLGIALGPRYEVGESSAAAAARPAGGLRADYGFVATMDREIRRDPERYVGYGITDSWDEIVETLQGAPVSTDTELGAHVREFESMVRRDTDEIYTMLDDEQSQRQLLAGRVNMLFRDRHASDLARAEVMSLRTTVHAQMSEITELQSADRSRQRAILDLLKTDRERHTTERDDSTLGTGHHTAGAGDNLTGTGDGITGAALSGPALAVQDPSGSLLSPLVYAVTAPYVCITFQCLELSDAGELRSAALNSLISSRASREGNNNGGNEVGADVGMGGGASGLVGESMKGGGNGREWEVATSLNFLIPNHWQLDSTNERIGLERWCWIFTGEDSDSGNGWRRCIGDGSGERYLVVVMKTMVIGGRCWWGRYSKQYGNLRIRPCWYR
ncbi:hypothetical protein Tco_0691674 [Tanacetum coccineum]